MGSLILVMIVVMLLSTIELGRILVLDIITPPTYLLDINELLDVFCFLMLILIGVELLETIRAYPNEHEVHVEIVLAVALIAVARKVVIVDIKEYSPETLLAIAAIVLSLAGAYYLQKRGRNRHGFCPESIDEPCYPKSVETGCIRELPAFIVRQKDQFATKNLHQNPRSRSQSRM